MDESVICVEDSIEIIDLSESINDSPGNSRNDLYEEFFVREKQNGDMKTNNQFPAIIDLSNKADDGLSKQPLCKQSEPRKSYDMCCPICFERLLTVSVKATVCGHVFCSSCIEAAVKETKNCPKCRKHITSKDLISLYL